MKIAKNNMIQTISSPETKETIIIMTEIINSRRTIMQKIDHNHNQRAITINLIGQKIMNQLKLEITIINSQ